jgi:MoxR-like ATPase
VETLPPPNPVRARTPVADEAPADDRRAATQDIGAVAAIGARLIASLDAVIAGKHDTVRTTVATVLSGGHLLIEDLPGVGKTVLAQTLARAVGGTFHRIQGTSDLLPADITGSMLPAEPGTHPVAGVDGMRFRPGPVFANVVVFDELNRATPRTQSALLELAEEGTVTVDGTSHPLPDPFVLVATQNPIDVAGTYGLGEGALDRFRAVVTPGRADADAELEVLTGRRGRSMLAGVDAVASIEELLAARHAIADVHVSDAVGAYVVELLRATRTHPQIRVGASTRGGVATVALARAFAGLDGRTYVTADDVIAAAGPALAHRVVGPGVAISTGHDLVAECLAGVPIPTV